MALESLKETNIRLEESEKELVLEIGSLTLRNFDLQEELKKIKESFKRDLFFEFGYDSIFYSNNYEKDA